MISELRGDGLIQIQAHNPRALAWTVPAWAMLCGVIASGVFTLTAANVTRLLLALLLVEASWGTLWRALSTTGWAVLFRRWQNWRLGDRLFYLPYTQPASPLDRASRWAAQLKSWAETLLFPTAGRSLKMIAAGVFFSLVIAGTLGSEMVMLTVASLSLMELAMVVKRESDQPAGEWDGILRLGLPWLAGHLAFSPFTLSSVMLAAAFSVAIVGIGPASPRRGSVLWVTGQALAAFFLIPLRHPLSAAFLILLLIPQLLLLTTHTGGSKRWTYPAWPWMAAGMMLTAWTL
ncbi:MAG: hypothetical protein JW900_01130 [Anaerolineae bacterium]|nr:hypothetical protein [Anaerolineae bacterium]